MATAIRAQTYTAVDLGIFANSNLSVANAINNSGTIVGYTGYSYNGEDVAFTDLNGVVTEFGTPSGFTKANAINTPGTVVGQAFISTDGSPYEGYIDGFKYSSGVLTALGGSENGPTTANGINDAGTIVGQTTNSYGNGAAFIYSNGKITILGTPGGPESAANGVNNAGIIVGQTSTGNGAHGFSYSNGIMTDLGTLGGTTSIANAINGAGIIIGTSWTSSAGASTAHAFSYSNGVMTDLGTLGGSSSSANAINNAGVIVGEATTSSGDYHAFLTNNGIMTDLDSEVNLPGIVLFSATGINDQGQIVANATNGHPYLLTPTSNGPSQVIFFTTNPTHYYGDAPFTLTATTSSGLAPTFSIVSGPATLNGAVVTITGFGTVIIQADQAGNGTFAAAPPVRQVVTVSLPKPSITWPAPANIGFGTALSGTQLDATASVPGSFSYQPAAGTVLGLGSQTLTVVFTPTDSADYATATATTSLTVVRGTPPIVWGTSAEIAYGTPLSSLQLNASAAIGGTFEYSPPLGTVLPPGINVLTVTFTPTDTTEYVTTTDSVTLTVMAPIEFYVSNAQANTICQVRSDGSVSAFASGLNEPNGMAFDRSGNLYVTNGNGGTVAKVTPAGTVSTFASGLDNPVGLAIDTNGNLYAADYEENTIYKITPGAQVSTFVSRLSEPVGLVFDPSGNLYVANNALGSISKITPAGNVSTFASGFSGINGLACDSSGNLYASNTNPGTIEKITPGGGVSTLVPFGSGPGVPVGLACDSGGNLYAVDATADSISKISPTGNVSNFSSSTLLSEPVFIVLAPVVSVVPNFVVQPASTTVNAGQSVTLTAAATGLPSYQWSLNGSVISGATSSSLTLANVQAANGGIYTATATDAAGSTVSQSATLTINLPPAFTVQPAPVTIATGRSAVFSALAVGPPAPTYQWMLNGSQISGATDPVLLVSSATAADTGTYACMASNGAGTTSSSSVALTVDPTGTAGYLTNIAARADVGLPAGDTGPGVLFGGFAISGNGTKQVLIRGVGPGLSYALPASFPASSVVADPVLALFNSGSVEINMNDNWGGTAALINAFSQTGAFQLQPTSLDAALLVPLPVSGYSAQVSTAGGSAASGTGLVEVYDAGTGPPTARIVNLSARAYVGTGSHILIGGFNIGGTDDETLLVRAVGPGLSDTFPSITNVLAQPVLQIVNSQGVVVYANTGWGGDATIANVANTVGAFPLNPAHQDSAALVTLPPGSYTALVGGLNGGVGSALVELYDVP